MICAVVLAAGRSSRMGAQKLLLPIDGRAMIAGIVDEVLQSAVEKTFVVMGCNASQIQAALSGRDITFINNPDLESDMLSSVRCGIRALPPDCQAALIVLGDQPGITHQMIDELIGGFRRSGRGIAVPIHGGKRGHPLLLAAKFFEEVATRYEAGGLRGLLLAHPAEIFELKVSCGAVLEDLDTPQDYARRIRATT